MHSFFLAIDLERTFMEGSLVNSKEYDDFLENRRTIPLSLLFEKTEKIALPFLKDANIDGFIKGINALIAKMKAEPIRLKGIGISCTGVVDYHGTKIEKGEEAFALFTSGEWKTLLESHYSCPVTIINDADAAAIGMAELDYLQDTTTIGVMTIGTELGFTVWRNGRRWRPGGKMPSLGSINTPAGSYSSLASISTLARAAKDKTLTGVLSNRSLKNVRENYFKNLTGIINTAAVLYSLDQVYISGELVDAACSIGFDLQQQLRSCIWVTPNGSGEPIMVKIISEGNLLQFIGATSLVAGERIARQQKRIPKYTDIKTETPYNKNLLLHQYKAKEIVDSLLDTENEAGINLLESTTAIAHTAEKIAGSIQEGGRLIYVGAGTSGRIAAMDAVEIPCTYGLPKDRVITLIAGGIADASIEIESNFEEDASSVPEMLLLNINKNDVVVGISASGSAYFVQSALAFAKSRGAYTVMVQAAEPQAPPPFCDSVLPLHSGYEVVAGSTRMKAGTATKRTLNCLTTTAMILNGEVVGPFMIGLACINKKLMARAQAILKEMYHLSDSESFKVLQANSWDMKSVIGILESRQI